MVKIGNDWDEILSEEFRKDYYLKLRSFLIDEYKTRTIFPSMHDIFNCLKYTAYKDVKAVILGQDPYHEPNQAHGLCFSVKKGIRIPPSLVNIYKELNDDLGIAPINHGCLESWAKEGVLLLNTVLTVRMGEANSHRQKGWEQLTDCIIRHLNDKEEGIVFFLWGSNAKEKKELITNNKHLVLQAAHPSPLSAHRGFHGCKHFSLANKFLKQQGKMIQWKIED